MISNELFFLEMQFQGMDTSLSPDQEEAFIQERSSTVFPVTPAASKLTMPVSRYAPLPPIDTERAADGDRDTVVPSRRVNHHHVQYEYVPVKTIGQVTTAEMVSSPQVKYGEKVGLQSEEIHGSKDLRTRFVSVQDHTLGGEKDDDTVTRDRKGETGKQKTVLNERTLTLEM